MPTPASALSCITCRSRKIKCDKILPCAACRRSGVECVFPAQRAQRRKQGRRNEELLRRLDHLEGLVDSLGGEVAVTARAASGEPLAQPQRRNVMPSAATRTPREDGTYPVMKEDGGRYLGEDFWTSLSSEVEGLRELLNEAESDDEPQDAALTPPAHDSYEKRILNSLFVFSGDIEATDLRWLHPPAPHIHILCDIYWDRIDCIFKLLHRPTMDPLLRAAAQDAAAIPQRGGIEALIFAMYFASVTSLSPDECRTMLGKDRTDLAAQFRHCCEISLANADFLNSTDMQVLQAFCLYLVCLRCHNKTRSVWTLVSLAVRIAQDLNLHRDGQATGFSPFDTEIRRRLWWQISVLDIRACEDRGSFPLIDHNLCSTKVPLNINDDDIYPDMRTPPPERIGCTDLSFSRLCQEASIVAPRFFSPVPASVDDDEKRDRWQAEIQQGVEDFKETLHSKFVVHCNHAIPIQHVISQVVQIVTSEFWLLVHYPIQTRRYAFKSKATKQEILAVAITHLRVDYQLAIHPLSIKYKWYYETYVQWHPLAVALAELCVQTRGPQVDEAWTVVDAVYERARSRVTDVSLWRPVKKLHQKARRARAHALRRAGQGPLPPEEEEDDDDTPMSSLSSKSSPTSAGSETSSMAQHLLPLDNLNHYLATTPQSSRTPTTTATAYYPQQHQLQQPAHMPPHPAHLPSQGPPATAPITTAQTQDPMALMSASDAATAHLSSMNLDAYGDPVNWADWADFVQSTWVATQDPVGFQQQQQKTENNNTPDWMMGMGGMGGSGGDGGSGY